MREIEFRAKSKFDKNKKWVYGDLIQGENAYISTKEEFYSAVVSLGGHMSTFVELVDKETIGRYTGIKDKNGTKIFEGDIHHHYDTHSKKDRWYIVCYGEFHDTVYNFDGYGWYFAEINGDDTESFEGNEQDYVNIVGNIYDNPELLEGI